MSELPSRLLGILLLKDGPQDLPAGNAALLLAAGLYLAATGASLSLGEGTDNPIGVLALALLLPLILVRIVLGLRGRPARWTQTLSALFGTSGLLSLLSLPLAGFSGSEPGPVVMVTSLVLFFWSFAVDGHIWRHALDTSFAVGLAVAVVLFAVSMSIITSVTGL